ncbi:MAG: HlyD family type I secretion periplasmic adaptor subunit [Burkholderiaceae bacterium]|nr:HlyD family type I secretion periplasmic adaptor subunit [Burkholderiaceae bacterium]
MKNATTENNAVIDIASRTEVLAQVNTNSKLHTRMGWWIIIAGVGGFIAWATYAPLDKGVPMSGTVAVATSKKAIQHLTGGTVEAILVKEGAVVKAGDVLVRMNSVQAKVNAETARIQYFTARATEARLIAERDGKSALAFSADLQDAMKDPRVANTMSLQQQLFSSRQSAIRSELSAFDENIAGLTLQKNGLEESREGKKQQLVFLKEQLDGIRDLSKDGFVARNRLLELERTYAQLNTAVTEDTNSMGRSLSQISEIRLRKLQRTQEYQKEVRTQLSDVQREADGLANRLTGLEFDLNNALVKAPVDGTVVGMNIFTIGGVIGPGFRMMDVVPSDDPLIVEGQLPVHLIDKVHPNLKVELIFTAFNQNQTPHIPGIVTNVSADRFVDEKSGVPYYSVKAKVAPEGMKQISNLQIRPGMPVDLFVKTGERTMMNYLLKPILDHLKMSMTEE